MNIKNTFLMAAIVANEYEKSNDEQVIIKNLLKVVAFYHLFAAVFYSMISKSTRRARASCADVPFIDSMGPLPMASTLSAGTPLEIK